jgi:hypothetical protein
MAQQLPLSIFRIATPFEPHLAPLVGAMRCSPRGAPKDRRLADGCFGVRLPALATSCCCEDESRLLKTIAEHAPNA